MRDYAKVAPTFWTGNTGQALRRRGFEGAYVGAYLMTSPHANMLGLFYQPVLYLAEETGLPFEGALKGLRICVAEGFCHYDEATKMVWVVEMAAWQIGKQLKAEDLRCKGIQKEYDSLQNNPFLGPFFDRYQPAFHLQNKRSYEGPSKPLRSQEQEQEHLQEQEQKLSLAQNDEKRIASVPDGFEAFWKLYPRKTGKGAAIKAYAKVRKTDRDLIAVVLPKFVKSWKWRTEPEYIPYPQKWLNERRWEDEPPPEFAPAGPARAPSRQTRIMETLINDQQYDDTAQRHMANQGHPQGLLAVDRPSPPLSAGRGNDFDDGEGLDRRP